MTDNPLISIIVPVYKVEKYLCRCVDSILAQTYTNIEVILVDDGSPDGCPAICDEYAAKDSRVVVIHQKNAGVSAARNAGLDIAKGEYIGFVDSDDWIEPDMYEVLFGQIPKNNIDIASIDFVSFSEGEDTKAWGTNESSVFTRNKAFQMICLFNGSAITVWSKLIKAELFSDIRFRTDITNGEDLLVCAQLAAKSEKIGYQEYHCYHYLQRAESATKSYKESLWTVHTVSQEIYELISKISNENLSYVEYLWINYDLSLLMLFSANNALTKERHEKLMAHMRIHYSDAAFEKFCFAPKFFIRCAQAGRIPFKLAYGMYIKMFGRKQ